jgi:hypothetical protein
LVAPPKRSGLHFELVLLMSSCSKVTSEDATRISSHRAGRPKPTDELEVST